MVPIRADADAPLASRDGVVDSSEDVEAAALAGEQESYRRYQAAEAELLEVLEADNVDDSTRKRRMMRVFDRFRYEYTQLSTLLREHIRTQRRIRDKRGDIPTSAVICREQCLEMKNELVLTALKIKTNQHVQDEEMKNLVFYRDECELAWKERKLSEERERDAMRIIDDLKSEIEELQNQVKALVATSTALPARGGRGLNTTLTSTGSLGDERPIYRGSSPSKETIHVIGSLNSSSKMAALKKQSGSTMTTSATTASSSRHPALSFDEWKHANRVWSPAVIAPRSTTPSLESLHAFERKQEVARCVSVPSLQPSAMEKATAAIAVLPLSPSPARKSRKPQTAVGFMRATTSSGGSRSQASSLPHV